MKLKDGIVGTEDERLVNKSRGFRFGPWIENGVGLAISYDPSLKNRIG